MGTKHYSLPTVDPDSTLSFPDAVNGLATATDAVLHGIQSSFSKEEYEPPICSSEILGVCRVGDGFEIYSDGLVDTVVKHFDLEPATTDKIGGVLVGKNMTVDDKGSLGVGAGAFADTQVGVDQLKADSITMAKIKAGAVNQSNLSADVENAVTGVDRIWQSSNVQKLALMADTSNNTPSFALFTVLNKIKFICLNSRTGERSGILAKSDGNGNLGKGYGKGSATNADLGFSRTISTSAYLYSYGPDNNVFLSGILTIDIDGSTATWSRKWVEVTPASTNSYWISTPTCFSTEV